MTRSRSTPRSEIPEKATTQSTEAARLAPEQTWPGAGLGCLPAALSRRPASHSHGTEPWLSSMFCAQGSILFPILKYMSEKVGGCSNKMQLHKDKMNKNVHARILCLSFNKVPDV